MKKYVKYLSLASLIALFAACGGEQQMQDSEKLKNVDSVRTMSTEKLMFYKFALENNHDVRNGGIFIQGLPGTGLLREGDIQNYINTIEFELAFRGINGDTVVIMPKEEYIAFQKSAQRQ